ncbi:hypothetical protein D3C73_1630150 [compost metagenome]
MKTRSSCTGVSEKTWLIDQLPATTEADPGSAAPEPMAEATTSKRPATTGVPAARPVVAAASGVTVPTMALG